MSGANSVLERKIAQCREENAQKDELIAALLREARDKMRLIEEVSFAEDPAGALEELRAAGASFGEPVLEREYGRLRSPLEGDERVYRSFARGDGLHVDLGQLVTPPYTLRVRFKSTRTAADDYAFSRNSPPMPMVCGPVAIYLIDQDTARILLGSGEIGVTHDFFDNGGWIDVCAKITPEGGTVFVDGEKVLEDSAFTNRDFKEVAVGCGHLERHWAGQIAAAAVVRGDWDLDDNELPDEGVLFRYDGNKVVAP